QGAATLVGDTTSILLEIPELDGIFGTNDVHAVAVAIRRSMAGERVAFLQGEYDAPEDAKRLLATASHMAYLKIAEGCDNNCTYCAIPAIRGHYRSRGRIAILAEAQQLAAAGVKEISLIAQDITLYGLDRSGQLELPELLEELVSIRGIEWIRLLYAYPERLDTRIIDAIARMDKVCNYLDLPLQHGVDRILHRMGRKLTVAQIVELLDLLRTQIPGISLRSSFIVGFPGETEHDFQKLLEFLHIARLDRTGFFVYSQEEGTAAARFHQQVPESIKQERLAEAIGVQSEIVTKKQQALVGQQFAAMVDGRSAQEEGVLLLRTYMQAPEVDGYVRVPQFNATPGTIVRVTINGFEGYDLLGKVNLP
ncbi:MAG: 30S ribosomal protein S12 methylthiotransferase RimO, partial [Firmicutes bacterium]|nr:30S ribosomal protein S12 methylthiotransferase RimO [Bacillota bacterium]